MSAPTQTGNETNQSLASELHEAAKAGDCAMIRRLFLNGADLDATDEEGRTAFHIASQYKQVAAMRTLLAARDMRYVMSLGVTAQEEKTIFAPTREDTRAA